jgi:GMP synthase (glutamine-hydrolysing)
VTSTAGMTADFYSFNMAFLGATATRSINEVNAGRGRRSRVS